MVLRSLVGVSRHRSSSSSRTKASSRSGPQSVVGSKQYGSGQLFDGLPGTRLAKGGGLLGRAFAETEFGVRPALSRKGAMLTGPDQEIRRPAGNGRCEGAIDDPL